ncbi:MAG: hypothetical protein R2769_11265 [Saprospiraceae bacterium]
MNNPDNWGQGLPAEGIKAVVPGYVFNAPVISGNLFLKYPIENFNIITIAPDAVICNESYFVNDSNGSITNDGS